MFSLGLFCGTKKLPREILKGIDDELIVKFTFVDTFPNVILWPYGIAPGWTTLKMPWDFDRSHWIF